MTGAARHRWHRVREHRRICVRCGTVKVNVPAGETRGGVAVFRPVFDLPDGTFVDQVPARTPRCAPGLRTEQRLREAGLPGPGEGLA